MTSRLLIALAGLLFLLGYATCTATAQNSKPDGGAPVADYQQARKQYEKAAATGDAKAMTALGDLYYFGRGVTQDYQQAKGWYEKAAAAGNARAMSYMGELYDYGEGVTSRSSRLSSQTWSWSLTPMTTSSGYGAGWSGFA